MVTREIDPLKAHINLSLCAKTDVTAGEAKSGEIKGGELLVSSSHSPPLLSLLPPAVPLYIVQPRHPFRLTVYFSAYSSRLSSNLIFFD